MFSAKIASFGARVDGWMVSSGDVVPVRVLVGLFFLMYKRWGIAYKVRRWRFGGVVIRRCGLDRICACTTSNAFNDALVIIIANKWRRLP